MGTQGGVPGPELLGAYCAVCSMPAALRTGLSRSLLCPFTPTPSLQCMSFCEKCKYESVSSVHLFVTQWTVASQARSIAFSRQEYWSGLPFPHPGDLLTQISNPRLSHCRQILYHLSHQESPCLKSYFFKLNVYLCIKYF